MTIHGVEIGTNDGLFCLNDLHQAAKNGGKFAPSDFLEGKNIQSIIAELKVKEIIAYKINDEKIWVCKELAVLFALSIDSAFYVEVFRSLEIEEYSIIDVPAKDSRLLRVAEIRQNNWNLKSLHTLNTMHKGDKYFIKDASGLRLEANSMLNIMERQSNQLLQIQLLAKK